MRRSPKDRISRAGRAHHVYVKEMSDLRSGTPVGRRAFVAGGIAAAAGALMPSGWGSPAMPTAGSARLPPALAAWLSSAGRIAGPVGGEWAWLPHRRGCELGAFLSGVRPAVIREIRAAGDRLEFACSDDGLRIVVRIGAGAAS